MAMEKILTAGVGEIIKKLLPLLEEHISPVAWGVKGDLRKLKLTLETIQATVSDAEKNQANSEADRLWLRRLKDVLYDADDVMDQYSYEYMRRDEEGSQLKHKIQDFVSYSSSNLLLFRFRIGREIRAINKTLDEIHKENKRYNYRSNTTSDVNDVQATEKSNRLTSSRVGDDSKILGRQAAKSSIISMMLNSRSSPTISSSSGNSSQQANPWVVSIVGMGGLGKTSLAQLIFKDSNLGSFDSKAWVCVSDDFRISNILIKMIESIDNGTKYGGSSDLEALGNPISIRLNGKNFLLVLDDLWNEDPIYWGKLMDSLVGTGAKSITILITTRSVTVASVVGVNVYYLERLTDGDCWSIMQKIISSRDERVLTLRIMTDIGEAIAKKCDGLPLAVKFLGSLMASNTDEIYWLSIKDNTSLWNT
ncbi:disease resistance protein RGA2-like [Papaver somniferum]|uniref:disease resistance protein RGA2-like n=1 Tax=Papaver somniferum TaxID=3469 RepID=UPI000E702689|nr:disease resistance protein RGA2-like [Papaver somniferum]